MFTHEHLCLHIQVWTCEHTSDRICTHIHTWSRTHKWTHTHKTGTCLHSCRHTPAHRNRCTQGEPGLESVLVSKLLKLGNSSILNIRYKEKPGCPRWAPATLSRGTFHMAYLLEPPPGLAGAQLTSCPTRSIRVTKEAVSICVSLWRTRDRAPAPLLIQQCSIKWCTWVNLNNYKQNPQTNSAFLRVLLWAINGQLCVLQRALGSWSSAHKFHECQPSFRRQTTSLSKSSSFFQQQPQQSLSAGRQATTMNYPYALEPVWQGTWEPLRTGSGSVGLGC